MKIFNLYENILKEEEVSSQVQRCVTNFGHELFGDELGGKEKNTNVENDYIKLIKRFSDNEYGEETSPIFIKAMKTLQTCTSSYPEVLHPTGAVYRGEKISFRYLYTHYKDINENCSFQYIYKSKSLIQSWSQKQKVGERFAFELKETFLLTRLNSLASPNYDNRPDDDKIKVLKLLLDVDNVLVYPVGVLLFHNAEPNSFLFKGQYFDKLSEYPGEEEILRIDKAPLQCVANIQPIIRKFIIELNRFKQPLNITADDFKL